MIPRWLNTALEHTPRGSSLDSLWQRVLITKLLLQSFCRRAWFPWGYGPRSMERAIIRWGAVHGVNSIPLGQPHNEILHLAYEYGLCGVASMAIAAALVLPKLSLGDPWSAAWCAGVVLACATVPFRSVSTGLLWLTACAHLIYR